ncbi:enhanced serine sensitivity protein SseB C-terminal domain-containing protein, partial [Streptomyces sp. 900105755]
GLPVSTVAMTDEYDPVVMWMRRGAGNCATSPRRAAAATRPLSTPSRPPG